MKPSDQIKIDILNNLKNHELSEMTNNPDDVVIKLIDSLSAKYNDDGHFVAQAITNLDYDHDNLLNFKLVFNGRNLNFTKVIFAKYILNPDGDYFANHTNEL